MRRDTPEQPTPVEPVSDSLRGLAGFGSGAERRLLAVLCLASVLSVVNFMALSPFLPEIARDLRTTVPLVGQVTAAITLLSAAAGLAIGPIADRRGARRLMVGGVVCVGLNLLGTAFAPSYPVLLLLAVIGGLGDAILFGLPLAIAGTRFAGAARRRAVAWTSAALSFGGVVGVPVIAAVGGAFGWRAALAGVGLLA
nr:MFS transporter [Chloroflexia bacterium]